MVTVDENGGSESEHHQEVDNVVPKKYEEEKNNKKDDLNNYRDNSRDNVGRAFRNQSLAGPGASEVLADGGVHISEFPIVVKWTMNHSHGSAMAIKAAEWASLTCPLF